MLAVEMLRAGHGDALVVEYGTASMAHCILVDGGTVHSYENVSARLLERNDEAYDAFIITHVDEDHIGGAIRLLNDPNLRHRVRGVWFNGYAHCKQGGDVLGPLDGERLSLTIATKGYPWNTCFSNAISPKVGGPVVVPSEGDLPVIELPGDAIVYLLSPSEKELSRMAGAWEKAVVKAGLVPGTGLAGNGKSPSPHRKTKPPLRAGLSAEQIRELAAPTNTDRSAANGSSIAFILEYRGTRALLAADAHPSTLVSSLKRFAKMKGEDRVQIDICKLPHHCSASNVTTGFIDAIDASCYLVSSDSLNFGHPDDAAIARILSSSSRPAQIYCNYASARTLAWVTPAENVGARMILPSSGAPVRIEVP